MPVEKLQLLRMDHVFASKCQVQTRGIFYVSLSELISQQHFLRPAQALSIGRRWGMERWQAIGRFSFYYTSCLYAYCAAWFSHRWPMELQGLVGGIHGDTRKGWERWALLGCSSVVEQLCTVLKVLDLSLNIAERNRQKRGDREGEETHAYSPTPSHSPTHLHSPLNSVCVPYALWTEPVGLRGELYPGTFSPSVGARMYRDVPHRSRRRALPSPEQSQVCNHNRMTPCLGWCLCPFGSAITKCHSQVDL